jgi:hypothetical protein
MVRDGTIDRADCWVEIAAEILAPVAELEELVLVVAGDMCRAADLRTGCGV